MGKYDETEKPPSYESHAAEDAIKVKYNDDSSDAHSVASSSYNGEFDNLDMIMRDSEKIK